MLDAAHEVGFQRSARPEPLHHCFHRASDAGLAVNRDIDRTEAACGNVRNSVMSQRAPIVGLEHPGWWSAFCIRQPELLAHETRRVTFANTFAQFIVIRKVRGKSASRYSAWTCCKPSLHVHC